MAIKYKVKERRLIFHLFFIFNILLMQKPVFPDYQEQVIKD